MRWQTAFTRTLATLAAVALPSLAFATDGLSELIPDAPLERFRVYGFDDTTGWRIWQLDGSIAEFPQDGSVVVRDLRFRVFKDGGEQEQDILIESPLAVLPAARDRVHGPGGIVALSEDFWLGGEDWTWFVGQRRLIVGRRAQAVIDGTICPVLE